MHPLRRALPFWVVVGLVWAAWELFAAQRANTAKMDFLDDLVRVKRLSASIATGNVLIDSNDGRKAEELPLKERFHIQGRVLGSWSLRSFA